MANLGASLFLALGAPSSIASTVMRVQGRHFLATLHTKALSDCVTPIAWVCASSLTPE